MTVWNDSLSTMGWAGQTIDNNFLQELILVPTYRDKLIIKVDISRRKTRIDRRIVIILVLILHSNRKEISDISTNLITAEPVFLHGEGHLKTFWSGTCELRWTNPYPALELSHWSSNGQYHVRTCVWHSWNLCRVHTFIFSVDRLVPPCILRLARKIVHFYSPLVSMLFSATGSEGDISTIHHQKHHQKIPNADRLFFH